MGVLDIVTGLFLMVFHMGFMLALYHFYVAYYIKKSFLIEKIDLECRRLIRQELNEKTLNIELHYIESSIKDEHKPHTISQEKDYFKNPTKYVHKMSYSYVIITKTDNLVADYDIRKLENEWQVQVKETNIYSNRSSFFHNFVFKNFLGINLPLWAKILATIILGVITFILDSCLPEY